MSDIISLETKRYLIELARNAIKTQFGTEASMPDTKGIPKEAIMERGVFVTLKLWNELRGCIGNIEPEGPLYSSVGRNAVLAAFDDPRFDVLDVEELEDVEIEISILTPLKELTFTDIDDLKSKLNITNPGVFIEKGLNRATFLPQVWEELEDVEEFLGNLCLKAHLNQSEWKLLNDDFKIYVYDVIKFSESDLF